MCVCVRLRVRLHVPVGCVRVPVRACVCLSVCACVCLSAACVCLCACLRVRLHAATCVCERICAGRVLGGRDGGGVRRACGACTGGGGRPREHGMHTVCVWCVPAFGYLYAVEVVVSYVCCARCDVYAGGDNNDAMMMIAMLRLMTMTMMLRTRLMTMTMMMLMTMVMLTMALRALFGRLGAVVNLYWAV